MQQSESVRLQCPLQLLRIGVPHINRSFAFAHNLFSFAEPPDGRIMLDLSYLVILPSDIFFDDELLLFRKIAFLYGAAHDRFRQLAEFCRPFPDATDASQHLIARNAILLP